MSYYIPLIGPDWNRGLPKSFWKRFEYYLSDRDLVAVSMVCRKWNYHMLVKSRGRAHEVRESQELSRQIQIAEEVVIRYIITDPASMTPRQTDLFHKSRLLLKRQNVFDIGMFSLYLFQFHSNIRFI